MFTLFAFGCKHFYLTKRTKCKITLSYQIVLSGSENLHKMDGVWNVFTSILHIWGACYIDFRLEYSYICTRRCRTTFFDLGIKLCNVSRYFRALTDSIKLSTNKCTYVYVIYCKANVRKYLLLTHKPKQIIEREFAIYVMLNPALLCYLFCLRIYPPTGAEVGDDLYVIMCSIHTNHHI